MTRRLFIAVEPSAACRQISGAAKAALAARFPAARIRWQPDENVHLTLAFLGNVDEAQVEECAQRLAATAARHRTFQLASSRLGAFPSALRPSVIWLGLQAETTGTLASLQRDIASAYRDIREDARPFRPHLTLGRVKDLAGTDRREFAAALAELPEDVTAWTVRRVVLFESRLTPEGAVHAPVASVELGS